MAADFRYSIEYSHIYSDEQVGREHVASLAALEQLRTDCDRRGVTHELCVLVDDYSRPETTFDLSAFSNRLGHLGAQPNFVTMESELVAAADEVVGLIESGRRRRSLARYIDRKGYPCSLFISTWYLSRLGKLRHVPISVTSTADRLINILPVRFMPVEAQAEDIIADTPWRHLLDKITNTYIVEVAPNA